MTDFDSTQTRVIRALFRVGRWATTNEIAHLAENMSWNTAEKTLSELKQMNVVTTKPYNKRTYWRIVQV